MQMIDGLLGADTAHCPSVTKFCVAIKCFKLRGAFHYNLHYSRIVFPLLPNKLHTIEDPLEPSVMFSSSLIDFLSQISY